MLTRKAAVVKKKSCNAKQFKCRCAFDAGHTSVKCTLTCERGFELLTDQLSGASIFKGTLIPSSRCWDKFYLFV